MIARICPRCFSADVHRSRRKSLLDRLVGLTLHRPYRCNTCDSRFYCVMFARKIERLRGAEQPPEQK